MLKVAFFYLDTMLHQLIPSSFEFKPFFDCLRFETLLKKPHNFWCFFHCAFNCVVFLAKFQIWDNQEMAQIRQRVINILVFKIPANQKKDTIFWLAESSCEIEIVKFNLVSSLWLAEIFKTKIVPKNILINKYINESTELYIILFSRKFKYLFYDTSVK
jgi:hypothetical protein